MKSRLKPEKALSLPESMHAISREKPNFTWTTNYHYDGDKPRSEINKIQNIATFEL
jgi:hypothetical protein